MRRKLIGRPLAVVGIAAGLIGIAALVACGILEGGGTESPAQATPSASASASPVVVARPSPSAIPSAVAGASIELEEVAWYDVTEVAFGYVEPPGIDDPPLPDPYTQLRVGTLDGHMVKLQMPPGALASGPFGLAVLAIQDDGATSTVSRVSVLDGTITELLATTQQIVSATEAPGGSFVYYVPVDRASATDLGLWRWSAGSGSENILSGPIRADGHDYAVGWRSEWSPDGRHLVVQACRQQACDTIVHRPADGANRADRGGELFGVTDDVYVAGTAGSSSVVTVTDLDDGQTASLGEFGPGILVQGGDRAFLLVEPNVADPRAYLLDAVDLTTGTRRNLVDRPADNPTDSRIWRSGDRASFGAGLPAGWILRWPAAGPAYQDLNIPPHEWFPGQLINVVTGETLAVPPFVDPDAVTECRPIPPAVLPSGAAPGDSIETYGGAWRWATWGSGSGQVIQVVGGWLHGSDPVAGLAVTIRGRPGRIVGMGSEDRFAIAWEEGGCQYEVELAPGIDAEDAAGYAGRY